MQSSVRDRAHQWLHVLLCVPQFGFQMQCVGSEQQLGSCCHQPMVMSGTPHPQPLPRAMFHCGSLPHYTAPHAAQLEQPCEQRDMCASTMHDVPKPLAPSATVGLCGFWVCAAGVVGPCEPALQGATHMPGIWQAAELPTAGRHGSSIF